MRLYLDFDRPLDAAELGRFRELVRRRAGGEPTAYLTGRREFFGRPFAVDDRVLVPRPETELLVDAALALLPPGGAALDVGTGSGALGVTLALERPGGRVVAVDRSAAALEVARGNARALGAEVTFLEGDLYGPLADDDRFDLIVSNPPYVPTAELDRLPREVRREPRLALDGGPDGLALLARLAAGAPGRLRPGGALVLEMHESHEEALPRLCREAGFATAEARRDLAGLPRLVVARLAAAAAPA